MTGRKGRLLLLLLLLLALAGGALAQSAIYVFPEEGFRYEMREDEQVLTRINVNSKAEFLAKLGTTPEAVLSNYLSTGIVMEVFPEAGGQISVSVLQTGRYGERTLSEMSPAEKEAFIEEFRMSGMYAQCDWSPVLPDYLRLTSSAMYGSMPVYSVRYLTLYKGRLFVFNLPIVGRVPQTEDDASVVSVISRVQLLSSFADPTPTPTPEPTPTPSPTPVAEIPNVRFETQGDLVVREIPSVVYAREIVLSGSAAAGKVVTAEVNGKTAGKASASQSGEFVMRLPLSEGVNDILVTCEQTAARATVTFERPAAKLTFTEPENRSFTGANVVVRGVTEPGGTVYVKGPGNSANVKADKTGGFNIRLTLNNFGTYAFDFTARAKDCQDTVATLELTREMTEKETIVAFRTRMVSPSYEQLLADPAAYRGKEFIFRGKVVGFTDYNGHPCAMVCVGNPATGIWNDPLYVVLTLEDNVTEEQVLTFYLSGEGITLPADGAYTRSGKTQEVPVCRVFRITENR